MSLKKFKWVVITEENAQVVFDRLKKQNSGPVLFGLTADNYEEYSINTADVRNNMVLTHHILEKYKQYYEQTKTETKED